MEIFLFFNHKLYEFREQSSIPDQCGCFLATCVRHILSVF